MSGGEEAGKERPHRCDGDNGAPAAIPRWGGGGRGRRRPKDIDQRQLPSPLRSMELSNRSALVWLKKT